MQKFSIIKLKQNGLSNRKVADLTGINRETVANYWNEYLEQIRELENPDVNVSEIQEKILDKPKYDISRRGPKKYSKEIDERLNEILESEKLKDNLLGNHKQKLTNYQIHEILRNECFDIGYTTISEKIKFKRNKTKECFIRQEYDLGDRLEYDFGEVKLEINGEIQTYHMAVLSSPGGEFRWAYLYKNQKKDVFMDSHVRFFDMIGGCYREIVYDNMKNVVTKFIGRNVKQLNEDLVKMSVYYEFQINVTNCFSGNEKGFVESSVKIIRNFVFAKEYKFLTFEHAESYLQSQLLKLNENSKIDEEKNHLLPYKPKLELGNISYNDVNKYSFVRVENNFYSVPEYLVGERVSVKTYHDKIIVYINNTKVCEHKRKDGFNDISIDITHYLNTFLKKPGAIKNSAALKSIPLLKTIFDKYFNTMPKKFIEILIKNKEKNIDEIIKLFKCYTESFPNSIPIDNLSESRRNEDITKLQLLKYDLCLLGRNGVSDAKH